MKFTIEVNVSNEDNEKMSAVICSEDRYPSGLIAMALIAIAQAIIEELLLSTVH